MGDEAGGKIVEQFRDGWAFRPERRSRLGVPTRALPKCQAQTRFTMTRAASGAASVKICIGQFEAAGAMLEGAGRAFREDGQEAAGDNIAGRGDAAMREGCEVARLAGSVIEGGDIGIGAVEPEAGVVDGVDEGACGGLRRRGLCVDATAGFGSGLARRCRTVPCCA